jgi:hypothetical protein
LLNQVRHPLAGPKTGAVSQSLRSLLEPLLNPFQICLRQFRLPPGSLGSLQPGTTGLLQLPGPARKELISSSHSIEEINRYITSDSLGYLSREGTLCAAGAPSGRPGHFCDACFSGQYPVKFPRLVEPDQMGLF